MKNTLILREIAGIFSAASLSWAHGPEGGYGPGMMWGYGMGWFWPLLMVAFWVAIIFGIIFLIRRVMVSTDKRRVSTPEETAEEILKKRYARGEISKEEFESIKKDIS